MDKGIPRLIRFCMGILITLTACRLGGDVEALRPKPEENPVPPIPSIPAPGVPIVNASDRMLTVIWNPVEEAETYEVYVGTTQEPPTTPVKTVSVATTILDGLINKTVYYVWIKAKEGTRFSDFSPRGRGVPWPANESPATPGRPVIIPGVNQLTVTWEESGGATSYEVYIDTSTTRPSVPEISTDKTNAVINNLENDVVYYLWVRAVNNAGKSGYSPPESGTPIIPTVAPSAPSVPVLIVGSHELTVSWHAVELAAAYEVWLGTIGDSAQAVKWGDDITGGVTETVITGLTNETTYYVWIKAKNIIGVSGFSPSVSARPSAWVVLPQTPAVPTVISGNRALDLHWPPTEGAFVYEVWIGVTNNPASTEKHGADVSDTSVTLTGLVNGTTYYIWVKAKNNIGISDFSPLASGTPTAFAAPPSTPTAAPMVTAGSEQLAVSWQAVEGAAVYEIWTGTANNSNTATKRGGDVSDLSAVITGLTNGTTYYVWIKAKNSVGTSSFSPVVSGTPSFFATAPQAPSVPAISIGSGQITVTWAAVQGAAAYEVWLGTENNSATALKYSADISASLSATISSLSNGTTYYVWLKAKNSIGTSNFSSPASGRPIAGAAVPILTAENTRISASWTVVAGADQYEVFCETGENPPQTPSQTISAPATSVTITGLVNGTSYNVWVRGKNPTGTGAMSTPANAKPIGNMGAVTINAGDGRVSLSWSSVAGADEYEVYYSTINTMPSNSVQTVFTTTATISELINGTIYYFWVKAVNSSGTGGVGPMASGTPSTFSVVPQAPAVPIMSIGNGQITVSWASVSGANRYEIYHSTSTMIPALPSFTVTETSRTFSGLTNGTTYSFWVKAVNANGTSGASPMVSSKPIGDMETVTINAGDGQLSLSWTAVAGADQYEVYYSTANAMPSSPAQTVSTTTATISELTNGTTYYVWVKPKNVNGAGSTSAAINAKPLGTPGAPTVSPANKQLHVTWTAVPGADEYEVYYGTSTPTTLVTTTTGTTATITGLINGMTYHVRLRAKNSSGVSDYGPSSNGVPSDALSPGLYRGIEKIGNQNLSEALSYISANAINGDDFYIVLGADESVSPVNLNYGKTVRITLMGFGSERTVTLNSNGSMFTVNTGVTLTLDENITLVGMNGNNASLVQVNTGGTVTMNGGTIRGNTGGWRGIHVLGGIVTMNGGEISGNTGGVSVGGYSFEGGVFVGGTFTMNGGTISGNTVDGGGGGVDVRGGTFTMNGGIISGNTAKFNGGGGVFVFEFGTFTMNGGTISGNTTPSSGGGGICIAYGGIFIMHDGTISKNTTSWSGGGGVSCSGIFTMYGGTISGNTTGGMYSDGGGVHVSEGTFTMHGGIISGNTAIGNSSNGGGVYVQGGSGTFRIVTGTVYGSDAAEGLKNTATNGATLYRENYGTTERGTFIGETWNSLGSLDTTNNTIRAVNGELQ